MAGTIQLNPLKEAWDVEIDLLVFGSGAGGLAAALFAVKSGLHVLLCEKSDQLGGTTATSGGMLWVPGTHQAEAAGIDDSPDAVLDYLRHEMGNYYRADLAEAFVESAGAAIAELETGTEMAFELAASPDYHPDQVGGRDSGRSIATKPFDGRRLGQDFGMVRPPMSRLLLLGGMMVGPDDIPAFVRPFSSVKAFGKVVRRVTRYAADRLRYHRGTELSNGNALVARFLLSLRQRKADIWTGAPLLRLLRDEDRVLGAIVSRNGREWRVRARRGVVLATGGFPHNKVLRDRYAQGFTHDRSMAFEGNTGDGITAATDVGAVVDTELISPGLWTPASVARNRDGQENTVIYGYLDRGRPGIIAVGPDGKRFVNESNSYHDIVMAMFARGGGAQDVFYFITDARFVRKHGLGAIRPWPWTLSLAPHTQAGYIVVGDTITQVAERVGLDPAALENTVQRHNAFAATGVDEDFGKGSTVYNRIWGDPEMRPNPNLVPIAHPPFVALRIVAATLGTCIGLKTNGNAAVLDAANKPIPGLFACGNELASAMRGTYPGGGVTLGPAVVFAHRAVAQVIREGGATA